MINFLTNSDIDRAVWDSCMDDADSSFLYARSWFLDIMTPGWCALVDHQYQTIFPLPSRKKFSISYLFIPPFMQKSGIFSREKHDRERTDEMLDFIPGLYRYIDISLADPGTCRKRFKERDNYILRLDGSYRIISESFTSACRRNIRGAGTGRSDIITDITPEESIALFRKGPGKRIGGVSRTDYLRLRQLMEYSIAGGTGKILGFRSATGLFYSVFFLVTGERITLLFTSTSAESRSLKAGYVMTDYLIREYAGSGMVLDFAGSSIPGVAQFISSFGATRTIYYRYLVNNLPWPLNMLKQS